MDRKVQPKRRTSVLSTAILLALGEVASGASLPRLEEFAGPLPAETPHRSCFETAALRHQLPAGLLVSVAKVESAFDPGAVSHKNAVGVMQILWPGTAAHLGIHRRSDLFVPCISIDAGARYLRELLGQFERLELALAAYNMGPARIRSKRVEDLPRAGKEYVALVARAAERYLGGTLFGTGRHRSYDRALVFKLPTEDRAKAVLAALRVRRPGLQATLRPSGSSWQLVVER